MDDDRERNTADRPLSARVATSLADLNAAAWDSCANPDPATYNPFVSHAFLLALEEAGTVGGRTGWKPQHVILEDETGRFLGAAPSYLKSHSMGEYVFDHAWADAYTRAGGRYYPKLLTAVPFSPVPGPRLLVPPGLHHDQHESALAAGLVAVAEQLNIATLHVNFMDEAAARRLGGFGFLLRTGQQFHWHNAGYETFDAFLATFASRKRKGVKKEREQALSNGITIEQVTGAAITEAHWDAMYAFYLDTGARKWGQPYLNRAFFSCLGASMADRCLLIFAKREGRLIAGALNMIGGDCLYGRYWGATEQHPSLHFEVCYYQAIDYAITHKLARVEAGAQGEHKLARGYMPATTYSTHWFADEGFAKAVARYLKAERGAVAEASQLYADASPFRRVDGDAGEHEHD
jgi:uncharacterized protein